MQSRVWATLSGLVIRYRSGSRGQIRAAPAVGPVRAGLPAPIEGGSLAASTAAGRRL
jgi:hypothetical protein